MALFHLTTLIPVGLEAQLACQKSWHDAHGQPVHTVNHSREHALLKDRLPDWVIPIEMRFAQRFGKDYIPLKALGRLLRHHMPPDADRVLMLNADIGLHRSRIPDELADPDCDLLYASRHDVDADGHPAGRYDKGYDVFSLHRDALSELEIDGVYLGMPWWDYVLPLSAVLNGRSVKRLDTDAFAHQLHPQRWSLVAFNHIGWHFMRQVLPAEMWRGAPDADQVMSFARVANRFLNSDVFVQDDPPTPAQIRADFIEAAIAGGVARTQSAAVTEGDIVTDLALFATLHRQLHHLYRTGPGMGLAPLRAEFTAIRRKAARANHPALTETCTRYARLIALRTGSPLDPAGSRMPMLQSPPE